MKITRERLEQLIKEELESQKETTQGQPEEDQKADVKRVLTHISAIDTREKYEQLIAAIIEQAHKVPQAEVILRSLHRGLPDFIEKLKK